MGALPDAKLGLGLRLASTCHCAAMAGPLLQSSALQSEAVQCLRAEPVRADRIGRKPVVVLANFIMGLATLGLGLAPTYWLAVAARALGGAANGSGVAIKTMLAEACDAQSQARGMVGATAAHSACSVLLDARLCAGHLSWQSCMMTVLESADTAEPFWASRVLKIHMASQAKVSMHRLAYVPTI